jgi:polyphosphate kinase 2
LTAAAVVIPKAMAYGTIAGLPVQVGLYTAFLPMVIYAALGTSRPLSVSTTTTIAILTGGLLSQVAPAGDPATLISALATLTLLVGGILILASCLRLGFIANFISEPVLIGFKAGIGLVIVVDQLPKILGIHFEKGPIFHNLISLVKGLPETSLATLCVGTAMIAILVGMERFRPHAPAPLIAVAAGIAGMGLLGLQGLGVESVGQIPRGLPSLSWPDFSLVEELWPGALGIAVMSFTETIAAGRAFSTSEEPPLRANQELLATGIANAGGALLGAMPAGGGTSQTAVNRLAGARTQLAEMVTAGATLLTMLLLAPLIGLMPGATLGAVVIVYSIGLIEPAEFRAILKVRRMEFFWGRLRPSWGSFLGNAQGDPRRHRSLAGGPGVPGGESACPRFRAQAGNERLPAPTEREKTQLYAQRYIPHLPAAGEVIIFDRSWYNRAGVERVMGFCTEEQARNFLNMVPLMEKVLVQSGIVLVKYWLEVSAEEQTRRLEGRIGDGRKIWKLSPMDLASYTRWDDYTRARDEMFAATDTPWAPWYVARSDDKRRARLNIISHLLGTIPYKKVLRDKITLPKRQAGHKYTSPKYPFKFIPEVD